jgi:hypothetical protein
VALSGSLEAADAILQIPLDLELDLFYRTFAFMLDVEDRPYRHEDALAGDQNLELFPRLQRIGQPSQLVDELRQRVVLLGITFWYRINLATSNLQGSDLLGLQLSYERTR